MKQAILGTALILMTVTGFILGRALVEQEVAVFKYENEAHQNACETYERAEAPEWYLFQNRCR